MSRKIQSVIYEILCSFLKPLSRKGVQVAHGAIGIDKTGKGLFITNGEYMVWTTGSYDRNTVQLYDPKDVGKCLDEDYNLDDACIPLCPLVGPYLDLPTGSATPIKRSFRVPELLELLKIMNKAKQTTVEIYPQYMEGTAVRLYVVGEDLMGIIKEARSV